MENGIISVIAFLIIIGLLLLTVRHVRIINRQVDRIRDLVDQEMTKKLVETTQQLENLDQIYRQTGLERGSLPPTRGWAASPDFLNAVYKAVIEHRPKVVVELGSGTSSVIVGHALRALGDGHLHSFDHDEHYIGQSRELLRTAGLENEVSISHAPLGPVTVKGESWKWYQIEDCPQSIDLLIVDGPPMDTGKLARYPAFPFFEPYLSENAVVLYDDAIRDDEQEIGRRYQREYPDWKPEYVPLEKGMFVIRKIQSS